KAQACLSAPNAKVALGRGVGFTGTVCSETLNASRHVQLICADDCGSTQPTTTTPTSTPSPPTTVSTTTATTTPVHGPLGRGAGGAGVRRRSEEARRGAGRRHRLRRGPL